MLFNVIIFDPQDFDPILSCPNSKNVENLEEFSTLFQKYPLIPEKAIQIDPYSNEFLF